MHFPSEVRNYEGLLVVGTIIYGKMLTTKLTRHWRCGHKSPAMTAASINVPWFPWHLWHHRRHLSPCHRGSRGPPTWVAALQASIPPLTACHFANKGQKLTPPKKMNERNPPKWEAIENGDSRHSNERWNIFRFALSCPNVETLPFCLMH